MALQGVIHNRGTVEATASEAIAVNLLVEDHTTAGQVSLCPADGCPMGVAYLAVDSGAVGTFQLLSVGDTVLSKGSASIAVGDYLKPAASGQVAPEAGTTTKTSSTIGVALSTCSGTGVAFLWRVTR
jgi:hypothetical protein